MQEGQGNHNTWPMMNDPSSQSQHECEEITSNEDVAEAPEFAINKVANIKRHYTQNHPDYDGRLPLGTARRQEQLDRLTRQANGQMAIMRGATSLQQRTATAGYEACYKIAKVMAPYSHSELFKKCMVSAVQALYPEKLNIQQAVQSVPLSRITCARRIEAIANHVTEGVIYNLNRCKSFSVAVDESTDINDVAQLSVFLPYYLNSKFSEDLAAVIPLTERMTGENIYQAFKAYMDSHKVSMHKIISVATDGAPVMVSDSQYDELLVHKNVRWLSKDRALQRVWTVRQHIEKFLSEIGGDATE
ncbi:zinc finger BED domain-containing protein 5-like [Watersipora subatra]|uniref:zinc finger BED domain-containing protein 5-like n=1 Tax=Watersipora subatra TaxID=2589382 RepID=UPI00355C99E2